MTRRQLTALTVPQLRDLARAAGLPVYQHRGRRLRKADLVAQLVKRNGRNTKRQPGVLNPEPGTLNPPALPQNALIDGLRATLVHRGLADLAPDPREGAALRRTLRGQETAEDVRLLRGRELRVALAYRDAAACPVLREFWNRYAVSLQLAAAPPTA